MQRSAELPTPANMGPETVPLEPNFVQSARYATLWRQAMVVLRPSLSDYLYALASDYIQIDDQMQRTRV
jgi:hypothetical protein